MTGTSVVNPGFTMTSGKTRWLPSWHWVSNHEHLVTRLLLFLGVVLRLRQYFFNRSLWVDESLLTLNLLERSVSDLLKPLSYHQGAPIGFLMLEKGIIRLAGSSEMALRLIPLLGGLASLFLFAALARRVAPPAAVPIAVGLFAISERLIYYSSEVKQYSTDVAFTLTLLLIASLVVGGRSNLLRTTGLCLAAGLSIWFSQPAAFVVAAIGVTWLWVATREHDRAALGQVVLFGAVTAGSFAVSYFVSLRHLLNDEWLMGYWNGGFMPFPPFSPEAARWFVSTWLKTCEDPLGLSFVGIATAAGVVGLREMFRDERRNLLLLVLPIFLALVASGMHRYPFRERLLLFAVPSMLLVISAGLAAIRSKTRVVVPGLGVLLIGLLFFQPAQEAVRYLRRPLAIEEIRPVLAYMEKHRSGGDVLYCYVDAEPALKYYTWQGTIQSLPTVIAVGSRQDWQKYRQDLKQLRGNARVWILFSHVYRDGGVDEELLFLDYLNEVGKREDEFHSVGASAYLYDLRAR